MGIQKYNKPFSILHPIVLLPGKCMSSKRPAVLSALHVPGWDETWSPSILPLYCPKGIPKPNFTGSCIFPWSAVICPVVLSALHVPLWEETWSSCGALAAAGGAPAPHQTGRWGRLGVERMDEAHRDRFVFNKVLVCSSKGVL